MPRAIFLAVLLFSIDLTLAVGAENARKPMLLRVELSSQVHQDLKNSGRRLKEAWVGSTLENLPSVSDVAEHVLDAVFGFKATKRLANQGLANMVSDDASSSVNRVEQLLRRTADEAQALAQRAHAEGRTDIQGPGRYWWQHGGVPSVPSDLLPARNGNTATQGTASTQNVDDAVPVVQHPVQQEPVAKQQAEPSSKLSHTSALEQLSNTLVSSGVLLHPNIWANEAMRRFYDGRAAAASHVGELTRATEHATFNSEGAAAEEHRRMELEEDKVFHREAAAVAAMERAQAAAAMRKPSEPNRQPVQAAQQLPKKEAAMEVAGAASEDPFLHAYNAQRAAVDRAAAAGKPAAVVEARQAVQEYRQQQLAQSTGAETPYVPLFGHQRTVPPVKRAASTADAQNNPARDRAHVAQQDLLMFGGDSRLAAVAAAARAASAITRASQLHSSQGQRSQRKSSRQGSDQMNEVEFLKQQQSHHAVAYEEVYDPDYYFAGSAQAPSRPADSGMAYDDYLMDTAAAHAPFRVSDSRMAAYDVFPDSLALQEETDLKRFVLLQRQQQLQGPASAAHDISDALAAELLDDSHEGTHSDSDLEGFLAAAQRLQSTRQAGTVRSGLLGSGELTVDISTDGGMGDSAGPCNDGEEWMTLMDVQLEWSQNVVVVNLLIDADAVKAANAIIDLEQELGSDAQGNPLVSLSLSILDGMTGVPHNLLALVSTDSSSPLKLSLNNVDLLPGEGAMRRVADAESHRHLEGGLSQLSGWLPAFLKPSNTGSTLKGAGAVDTERELVVLDEESNALVDEDGLVVTFTSAIIQETGRRVRQYKYLMLAAAVLLAILSIAMAALGVRDLYSSTAQETVKVVSQAPGPQSTRERTWITVLPSISILPQSENSKALEEPLLCKESGKC